MAQIEEEEPADTGGWINTFADLMNLLLCFFVLLFSMSTVDADKYEQLVTSMSESINIFDGGGESIGQGPFIDSGTDQIVAISQYFNEFESSGQQDDANQDQDQLEPGTQSDASGQNDNNGQQSSDGQQPSDSDSNNDANNDSNQNSDASDGNQGQQQDDQQPGQQQDDQQPGQQQDQNDTSPPQNQNDGQQSGDNIDKATEEAVEAKQEAEQKKRNDQVYEDVMEDARDRNVEDQINVQTDKKNQYVQITLNGALLFDSGSADIKSSVRPLLNKVGAILKTYKKNQIRIIGHTDSVKINSAQYPNNMWLSTARATTVFEYLLARKDISAKHAETTGRGEYDPIASNKTAEGRAKNRRVEFRIYTNQ